MAAPHVTHQMGGTANDIRMHAGNPAWKSLAGYDRSNEYEARGYAPYSLFMGQPAQSEHSIHFDREYNHFQLPYAYLGKVRYLGEFIMGLMGYEENIFLTGETDGLPIRRVDSMEFAWEILKFNRTPFEIESEESVARIFKVSKEKGHTTTYRRAQAIFVEHNFFLTPEGLRLFGMQLQNMANNLAMTLEMLVLEYIISLQPKIFQYEVETGGRFLPSSDMVQLILDENAKIFRCVKAYDGLEQIIAPADEALSQRNNPATTILTTPKIKKYFRGVGDALDYTKMGPQGPALAKVSPDSIKTYNGKRLKYVQPYITDNSNQPYDPFVQPHVFGQFMTMFGEDPNTIKPERYRSSNRTIKVFNQTANIFTPVSLKDAYSNITAWEESTYIDPSDGNKVKKMHTLKGYYKDANIYPWSSNHGHCDLFGTMTSTGYRPAAVIGEIFRDFVSPEMIKLMVDTMLQETPSRKVVTAEHYKKEVPHRTTATDGVFAVNVKGGNFTQFKAKGIQVLDSDKLNPKKNLLVLVKEQTKEETPAAAQKVSASSISSLSEEQLKEVSKSLSAQSKKLGELIPASSKSIHAGIVKAAKHVYLETAAEPRPDIIKNYLDKTAEHVESLRGKDPIEFEDTLNRHLDGLHSVRNDVETRQGKEDFAEKMGMYTGVNSSLSSPVSLDISSAIPDTTGVKVSGVLGVIKGYSFDPEKHVLVDVKTMQPAQTPEDSYFNHNDLNHTVLMQAVQTANQARANYTPYKSAPIHEFPPEQDTFDADYNVEEMAYKTRALITNKALVPGEQALYEAILNSYITKEFFDFLFHNDIPIPFGFILARPWNQYHTALIVLGRMGAATGITAVSNEDMMFGDDVSVKTHLLHFSLYCNPVIFNPYAFSFVDNAAPLGYIAGGNATFFSAADIEEMKSRLYEPVHPSERDNLKNFASMLPIMTVYRDLELQPVIDLRRNFPTDDQQVVRPHFVTTKSVMDEWGFADTVIGMRHPADPRMGRANMICSIATHMVYNPLENAITRPVIGQDFMGRNVYGGMMDIMNGKGSDKEGVLTEMHYAQLAY